MGSNITIIDGGPGGADAHYWVVGGVYTDADFQDLVVGGDVERHGPFAIYKAALEEWGRLSWRHVDDCNAYYRIEAEEPATPES